MLARLGKKADNVEKLDKSGREVCEVMQSAPIHFSSCASQPTFYDLPVVCACLCLNTYVDIGMFVSCVGNTISVSQPGSLSSFLLSFLRCWLG